MRTAGLVLVGLVAAIVVAAVVVWRTQPEIVDRAVYPLRYEHIVRGHAANYELDPALLAAVIYAESKFDPRARSRAGAIGLMQLLPDTARGIAQRTGGKRFVLRDLYDPEINVRYGAWYLRHLLRRYEDVPTALAAYHAGLGNVDRWRSRGGGVAFPETRAYVEKVVRMRGVYRRAYDLG